MIFISKLKKYSDYQMNMYGTNFIHACTSLLYEVYALKTRA